MTTLNDTQSILLSTAGQRDSGSLYPFPGTPTDAGRATKAIVALVKRGFVEERETADAAAVVREDGDPRYAGGLAAIGLGDGEGPGSDVAPPLPAEPEPKRQTEAAAVAALRQRHEGATPAELIAATGWLPHTARAALTGLRKKGDMIERSKRDDATCYRIVVESRQAEGCRRCLSLAPSRATAFERAPQLRGFASGAMPMPDIVPPTLLAPGPTY